MEKKTALLQIKDFKADEGSGRAVFATMEAIDRDGDWTERGAFGSQTAKLVGAHDWSGPSIGLAKIREEGNEAVADFRFNMEMASAADWYKSLKFNFEHGIPQEFSYGFDIEESGEGERDGQNVRILKRLKVFEVSPVMVGAGVGTRLQSIKSQSLRMDEHFSLVVEAIEEFLSRTEDLAVLRRKEGKQLSASAKTRLVAIAERFPEIDQRLKALLEEEKPTADLHLLSAQHDVFMAGLEGYGG